MDVVHAGRPDGFDAVPVSVVDRKPERIGACVQKGLHVVVLEGAFTTKEYLADLRVVREVVE